MLQKALEVVVAHRAGEMHINVDEVDTDTRRFYERHGFGNVEPGAAYRMPCYLRELYAAALDTAGGRHRHPPALSIIHI